MRELKPGARVVSHVFNMGPEWPPEKTLEVDRSRIFLWTIPAAGNGGAISTMARATHRRRAGCGAGASDTRARRHGGRRRLRPGARRPIVSGGGVGHGERTDLRPADAHERRRERDGQRRGRAGAALEDSRHPARCAPHQERRRHRGDPGQRYRQVRQARRRDCRSAAGHQSARHDGQHGHQRHQVQGRGDLLAASDEPEDRARDRARAARRAEAAGRARGPDPLSREAEHSPRAGADVDLRSDDRDRRRRRWSRPRTARASRPTASAPATRPSSSTRPPTSRKRR